MYRLKEYQIVHCKIVHNVQPCFEKGMV